MMKKNYLSNLFFVAAISLFANLSSLYAQSPGSLDLSFGGTGYFSTAITTHNNGGRCTAIQADGKIVVAGYANNGSNDDFAVVRYNTNGSLDANFGVGGMVTTDLGGTSDYAFALILTSGGKILIGGYSQMGINEDFAMARYDSNGNLDASFGINGIVTNPIGNSNDEIWSLGVQSDGKIMAGGVAYSAGNPSFVLARYTDAGNLDASFASIGYDILAISGSSNMACSILVQSDNKTVIVGYSGGFGGVSFGLARYDLSGNLDASFGTGGKVKVSPSTATYNYGFTSALNSDGSILVAGASNNGGTSSSFIVAKFTSSGALDNSFGSGGKITTSFGNGYAAAESMSIQADGKIILAGYVTTSNAEDFAVVRYNATGSIDNTFGTSGKVITSFGPKSDYGFSVAVQADGKIVVAGFSNDGTNNNLGIVRYHGNLGTGLLEYSSAEFGFYPNPTGSQLFINGNGIYNVEIFNMEGQSLFLSKNVLSKTCLDVSRLPSGIFMLRVQSGNGISMKKFVKI